MDIQEMNEISDDTGLAYEKREFDTGILGLLQVDSDGALWIWVGGIPTVLDSGDVDFLQSFLLKNRGLITADFDKDE